MNPVNTKLGKSSSGVERLTIRCLMNILIAIRHISLTTIISAWASSEDSMWSFSYKKTTAGLEGLPRKVAMVLAKGTLDFAKEVSTCFRESSRWCVRKELWVILL